MPAVMNGGYQQGYLSSRSAGLLHGCHEDDFQYTTYMDVGSADIAGENICRPCRFDGSILPADSLKITYCTCLLNILYIVGFSNQRNRVYGFTAIRQTCFYVVACHGAIAGINVGIVLFDFIDHRFANFHGGIVTFTF